MTLDPLILIVAAADTGRAPMAAALLRRILARRAHPWAVESAGVVGHDGDSAQPEARDVMTTMGLDISGHIARSLDDDLAAQAALLLAIDRGVARVLQARYPAASIAALGELAGTKRDIPDPFRMQAGAWLHYAQELETMLRAAVPGIVARLGAPLAHQPADEVRPEQVSLSYAQPQTAHPARLEALDRCLRLLSMLADFPGAVDWPGARTQISGALENAAAHPFDPHDQISDYVNFIRARLDHMATTPSPAEAAALSGLIAALRAPVTSAQLEHIQMPDME